MDGQASLLAQLPTIPAMCYRIFRLVPQPHRETRTNSQIIQAGQLLLENEFLRVKFNKEGEILSLWDKEFNREVLVEVQRGNHFQLFEDMPGKYDAWDIVASFADHEIPLSETGTLVLDETGPVRTSLRLENRSSTRS
jgi:alpha-mannosidase